MARIKGKNTKPEMLLRQALWRRGARYRLHYKTPAGRPDVVFPGPKIAIFVDGCQWHGCPEHYVRPRTRTDFWGDKLRRNVERDQRQTRQLETSGWSVLRFWEHTILEAVDAVAAIVLAAKDGAEPVADDGWRVIVVNVVDPDFELEERRLVSLRDPNLVKVVRRRRSTKKWRRSRT